jgi:hydrogenase maturation protein HypF
VATFKAIPLAGGDAAIREPWRIALALVDAAFGEDAPLDKLALFGGVPRQSVHAVRQMIANRFSTPLGAGIGRYFDGFGALGLARTHATYEGQVALEWNLVADPSVHDRYVYSVDDMSSPWVVDLTGAVRRAVTDIVDAVPAPTVSARFHNTVAAATADVVCRVLAEFDRLPVVLTGGCFQNARLSESVIARLAPVTRVLTHGVVPPGDGGIALGQAVVADAVLRRRG